MSNVQTEIQKLIDQEVETKVNEFKQNNIVITAKMAKAICYVADIIKPLIPPDQFIDSEFNPDIPVNGQQQHVEKEFKGYKEKYPEEEPNKKKYSKKEQYDLLMHYLKSGQKEWYSIDDIVEYFNEVGCNYHHTHYRGLIKAADEDIISQRVKMPGVKGSKIYYVAKDALKDQNEWTSDAKEKAVKDFLVQNPVKWFTESSVRATMETEHGFRLTFIQMNSIMKKLKDQENFYLHDDSVMYSEKEVVVPDELD